jgi:hypothetical protein
MKFTTKDNRNQAIVVVPKTYQSDGFGHRELRRLPSGVTGLRAEFVNGSFDTEAAQRSHGWSDDDRLLVEEVLQRPEKGYGSDFFRTDDEGTPERIDPNAPRNDGPRCVFSMRSGDKVEVCGRKVDGESEYCVFHQPEALLKQAEATLEAATA